MKGMNGYTHLAKALLTLAQDFANTGAVQKVLDLLLDL